MRRGSSLRRRMGEGDWMDVEGAIGGDKHWNVAEGRRDYVYALALSRARAPAPGGRLRADNQGRLVAPMKDECARRRKIVKEALEGIDGL
ncbi:MAG: hypothetical protein RXS42_04145 [Nitrososphaeria archaeon]